VPLWMKAAKKIWLRRGLTIGENQCTYQACCPQPAVDSLGFLRVASLGVYLCRHRDAAFLGGVLTVWGL